MPMYDGPVIPDLPLLHDCLCAQFTTATASLFSRGANACQTPSDDPVPRASTVSWR